MKMEKPRYKPKNERVNSGGFVSLREQRQSLDIPGKMMHGAGGRENHRPPGRECKSDQSEPCDLKPRFAFRSNLHDAALAGKRSRHVQIPGDVKREALRPPQPAVEGARGAVRIDLVDAVKAGCGRPGYEQIPMRAKGEVIRRNTGFQCGKHENLLVARDFEDRATAVADIQVLLAVKRDPGG